MNETSPETNQRKPSKTPLAVRMGLAGILIILAVPPITIITANAFTDTGPMVNAAILLGSVGAGIALLIPGILQLNGRHRRHEPQEREP